MRHAPRRLRRSPHTAVYGSVVPGAAGARRAAPSDDMDTLDPRAPAERVRSSRRRCGPRSRSSSAAAHADHRLGAISRIGVRAIGKGMYDHRHGVWHGFVPERLADPWANWDGQWFIRIASDGYHRVHSEAFFPLYPFIIRYVDYITGNYVLAGTSSRGSPSPSPCGSSTAWCGAVRRSTAAWTVAFLSFFPTSFYLTPSTASRCSCCSSSPRSTSPNAGTGRSRGSPGCCRCSPATPGCCSSSRSPC